MQTANAIVDLNQVAVNYDNGVQALEDITLQIFKGDIVGIIGPNGAGKSTLLSVILGLLRPTAGRVTLFGQPITGDSLRRVGYVPQKAMPEDVRFPSTVYEIVLMGRVSQAGMFHRLGEEDHRIAEKVMRELEIYDLRDRRIGQLSGGQTQRVFLAKALVGNPELLILDEPTSGVDARFKREFYDLLGSLNKDQGMTLILSSHDIGIVTKLANRIVCINRTLFFCGEASKLEGSRVLAETYDYPVDLVKHHDHA